MDRYDYQTLANEAIRRGINLFESFGDWTKGAFALSNLGEDGRAMFKGISKLSGKYDEAENDRKFTNALHTNGKVGIATFIYMCRQRGIDTNRFYVRDGVGYAQPIVTHVNHRQKCAPHVAIPRGYITQSLDTGLRSSFVSYLKTLVSDVEKVIEMINAYQLGVTKEGRVIFWYIGMDGVVRMGKAMAYKADGHRDKSVTPLSIPWVLSRRGELTAEYVIRQTLFGEHLLCDPQDAGKVVGIVESEKSAVICSLCIPSVLWVATGSMGNLQTGRMEAVKGRRSILFPDTDISGQAYTQWAKRADRLNAMGWHIQICNYLEKIATTGQRKSKIDMADLLVDDLAHHRNTHSAAIFDTVKGLSLSVGSKFMF